MILQKKGFILGKQPAKHDLVYLCQYFSEETLTPRHQIMVSRVGLFLVR